MNIIPNYLTCSLCKKNATHIQRFSNKKEKFTILFCEKCKKNFEREANGSLDSDKIIEISFVNQKDIHN